MRTPQNLIWLPTGGHLGDAVMIASLFAEALERSPGLKIYYLVRRNAPFIADIVAAYPNVTVVPVPYAPWRAIWAVLPLLKLRAAVVAPPAWGPTPLSIKLLALALRLRGSTVVGFREPAAWQPYSAFVVHDRSLRYIDNLRKALTLAGLPARTLGEPPRLKFASKLPANFPFEGRPYIVVHPFPHMSTRKTMPLRRWRELVEYLKETYPSYGLVITGAEVDRAGAERVAAGIAELYTAINLPIREVAGLIEHARLYIGVDTGPTHIAGVLGAPSVILAQQNEPMWLPSYNPNATLIWESKNCRCGHPGEVCEVIEDSNPYRRCVYDISDAAIHEAIGTRLATGG